MIGTGPALALTPLFAALGLLAIVLFAIASWLGRWKVWLAAYAVALAAFGVAVASRVAEQPEPSTTTDPDLHPIAAVERVAAPHAPRIRDTA